MSLAETTGCGGSTPTKSDLVDIGRATLDYFKIAYGTRALKRLAQDFKARWPHGKSEMWFVVLAAAIGLSAEQKRRALADRRISRLMHPDPVPLEAIPNVMKSFCELCRRYHKYQPCNAADKAMDDTA